MNPKRVTLLGLAFLLLVGSALPALSQKNYQYDTAVVYYNEACSMCARYLEQDLLPTLREAGIAHIIKKDYVNEKQSRVELNELNKRHNIPPTLQGHFMTFIDDRIMLGGHVPKHVITDLLAHKPALDRLLVLQDEMNDATSYFAWGFKGEAKEYAIETPIQQYIEWFQENEESLKAPETSYESSWSVAAMLPLIISTGFLDGINPCAFAVLLFFIAFLYTIKRTKANILKMGVTYILAIFLAYFLIGIGLVKAFVLSGYPHFLAAISAYLLIGLGLLSIGNFIWPKRGLHLGIPSFTKGYLKRWMYKATLPTTFILGFLVGLCTFPCSGGMYVAIIGLLASTTTYAQGFTYLIIYNVMFVMPLVIILAVASSKRATNRITAWEQSTSGIMRLIAGIVMVALGLAIIVWFI